MTSAATSAAVAGSAVSTWTSVHLHHGTQITATVHPDRDRAVIELGADSLRTVVSVFADRAELMFLHTVIGRAVAELDAHVPPVRITVTDPAVEDEDATPAA